MKEYLRSKDDDKRSCFSEASKSGKPDWKLPVELIAKLHNVPVGVLTRGEEIAKMFQVASNPIKKRK
jgi:hypothetical protein